MTKIKFLLLFCWLGSMASLFAQKTNTNTVKVHILSDVQHLNILTATDATSTVMGFQTHQTLYALHPETYDYVPVLAKELATQGMEDDLITFDFEIRPEARWDNGDPITGEDVVFSLKLSFLPSGSTGHLQPYLDYIKDIVVDKQNPKKFRVISKRPYMSAETAIAAILYILPAYVYDPEGVLENYDLAEMLSDDREIQNKLKEDERLTAYTDFFNSPKFKREVIAGSGAYAFKEWKTNQYLSLSRKKNWWGDQVKVKAKGNPWFKAYPQTIEYVTIHDFNTAVAALKKGKIDAMQMMPNKTYVEMRGDKVHRKDFHFLTPPLFSYDYIGINMADPRLADGRVRKALAHLMDRDKLIEQELYGLGEKTNTFIHKTFQARINPDLKPYEYDLAEAKRLLAEAGWKDTDNDGILDKEIDGERQSLSLRMDYNNGNHRRETTCILFKEAARKVGIEIEILPLEWATYLKKHSKHDFDLFVAGWVSSPVESDPKQIWHRESYFGGSNYTKFGTAESDALIDHLRIVVDDELRFSLYKELQAIIHEECPYIFLISQKNRVVISKRFKKVNATGLRSGFLPQLLR